MKNQSIKINGAEVALYWHESGAEDSLGKAVHTVDSDAFDEGPAPGPSDGHVFDLEGKKFHLGQHDYETSDGRTTCTAEIYAEE